MMIDLCLGDTLTPLLSAVRTLMSESGKARRMALRHHLAVGGDRIEIMAGIPFGTAGSTNVLHVVRLVGDELERHTTPE